MNFSEPAKGCIQFKNVLIFNRCHYEFWVQVLSLTSSSMFDPGLPASILDQNPSHGLGRSREKVSPIRKTRCTDEAKIGFVNKAGRIQCLPRLFVCELLRSKALEFLIDERQ